RTSRCGPATSHLSSAVIMTTARSALASCSSSSRTHSRNSQRLSRLRKPGGSQDTCRPGTMGTSFPQCRSKLCHLLRTAGLKHSLGLRTPLHSRSRPVAADQSPPAHSLCRDLDSLLRSEEHTSELQSRGHLVCRLLLE